MARVVHTDLARADLREILRYLRGHSRPAAERLAQSMKERARRLAKFPRLGRERPEFGSGIRSTVVGDYVLVYHTTDTVVTVVRIFHGSRDIETLIRLTDWQSPDAGEPGA
jgi:toxin ParE1/3/4